MLNITKIDFENFMNLMKFQKKLRPFQEVDNTPYTTFISGSAVGL